MNQCTNWAWLCWIEGHPGLAGYVQAVGAILALVASYLLARRSGREARMLAFRPERYLLRSVERTMDEAVAAADRLRLSRLGDPELGHSLENSLWLMRRSNPFIDQISNVAFERIENAAVALEDWLGNPLQWPDTEAPAHLKSVVMWLRSFSRNMEEALRLAKFDEFADADLIEMRRRIQEDYDLLITTVSWTKTAIATSTRKLVS